MRIIGKTIWTFNAYVWALALAFWGWMSYMIAGTFAGNISFMIAMGSGIVVAYSVWRANQ